MLIFDYPGGAVLRSESPGEIIFRNNTVVGTRSIGTAIVGNGNRFFKDRLSGGLPPYPELSKTDISQTGPAVTLR